MRRKITYPFTVLIFFLFFWVNLPKLAVEGLRSFSARFFLHSGVKEESGELSRLQLENQQLRSQLEYAYEWILSERKTQELFDFLKEHPLEKRSSHLKSILRTQAISVPAQVIYRDPSSWSSSLWVNVGEENNRSLGRVVVAKNSPVLSRGALIGVVDHVGDKQSRIRLLTDSGVTPAVRVCRGAIPQRELAYLLEEMARLLEKRNDLFLSEGEKGQFLSAVQSLKKKNNVVWEDGYLAKGEVHGSSAPFWRSRSPVLRGIGFHFDEMDGSPTSVPLVKEGDLLVTSGLDGVFPSGLKVGTVSRVDPLREGGYTYDIEVRPAAGHFNDLQVLNILPPLE